MAKRTPLFVSMEMTLEQIAKRHIAICSGINPDFITKGQLSRRGEQVFRETIRRTRRGMPIHLVSGDMNKCVDDIERIYNELCPEIIFVDAAYLLSPNTRNARYVSRWEQIGDVIKALKQLAIRIGRPIVITVQLNRNVKSNSRRKIDTTDIGGSDAIPQDCNILIGMRYGVGPNGKKIRVCDIIKNRDGDTGTYAMNFTFTPMLFTQAEYDVEGEEKLFRDDEDAIRSVGPRNRVQDTTSWMV